MVGYDRGPEYRPEPSGHPAGLESAANGHI
jgi:hypothetical protein